MPIAIELPGLGNGYRLGAGVRVTSGAAAGRQLYCTASAGDILFCDGRAAANLVRLGGVQPGDLVHDDNHAFLAFCYYYSYHNSDARSEKRRIGKGLERSLKFLRLTLHEKK